MGDIDSNMLEEMVDLGGEIDEVILKMISSMSPEELRKQMKDADVNPDVVASLLHAHERMHVHIYIYIDDIHICHMYR